MALVLKDRVKETTTSTGTGTINLAGAATGFEGFASAVGDGNTCYYAILDANGSAWEVGIGTVTDAATDTLSRDTILESSNSDNAISLTSGTHTVFLTYPADKSVYRNSNDQIVATASGIVFSDSTVQTTAAAVSGDNVSIFVNDAGYLTTESDTLQTVTDRGSDTTNSITSSGNITATTGILDVLDLTLLGNGEQPSHSEGVVFYDSENHTLSLYNDEPNISLQIGQEQYVRVRNNTAATIGNGTAVLFNGVHGNSAPTVSGAIATSEATSQVIGLATHSIEPDTFGYVTTYGVVRDVDTSVFSAGDELYLSATQIGSGVNTSPVLPNFKTTIGHVIRSHPSNGSILVQVGNAKLGGGDVKSEASLNVSGVPFITSVSDTTAGGVTTVSDFVYDSGNNQLQLGSGVQLLNAVPGNTTNVLYNDGGTLKFNGSAVDTTYTAGSGLELDSTTFNAKTATTSTSGITTLTNTIDSTQTKALTPKAVDDAGYGTMSNFILEDGDGTEVTISNAKEVKFVEGSGIDIDWTDVSDGSDSDPYDLTFTVDHDAASNFVANEHVDHTSVTLTAGSGLSGGGDISSNRTFNALTATTSASGITTLTNTINGDQDKALTPKAVNDANYLTSESDTLQTVTGRGAVTTNDITVSGELVVSRPEAFAALKVASSGQQISFGNRGEDGNDGMVTIKLDDDGATYAASSGVQVSLNSAKSALAVVPTAGDTTIPRTVFNGGDSSIRPDGDAVVNIKSIHEDVPNLIVYGKSGGTSHLTEWKDSDGDTVAYIGEKGTLSLGKDFHIQKFDSYVATGVGPTDASGVALTFNNETLHNSYSYRIRCYDEDSNRQDGSVFLARKNDDDSGNWDVTTVAIQKNSQNEYPIVFNDGGTLKVKTGGVAGLRDIIVYIEGIYINRNDVTGYIWGADFIWSKVSTAGGSLHSIYTSGNVGVGTETPVSAINLVGGSYVNEAVPASDTPTTEDATVTLDLSDGNYHNIVLGANVTKFEFTNAKRGQKFILRITQHASSAKTVAWTNVDSDTGGTAATVRWAGNIAPTMTTTVNHTDIYGFLCTNNAGTIRFDGFIIGQDLPD